jgi:hypothetical protein
MMPSPGESRLRHALYTIRETPLENRESSVIFFHNCQLSFLDVISIVWKRDCDAQLWNMWLTKRRFLISEIGTRLKIINRISDGRSRGWRVLTIIARTVWYKVHHKLNNDSKAAPFYSGARPTLLLEIWYVILIRCCQAVGGLEEDAFSTAT